MSVFVLRSYRFWARPSGMCPREMVIGGIPACPVKYPGVVLTVFKCHVHPVQGVGVEALVSMLAVTKLSLSF